MDNLWTMVLCPECQTEVGVKADGKLFQHPRGKPHCPASGWTKCAYELKQRGVAAATEHHQTERDKVKRFKPRRGSLT